MIYDMNVEITEGVFYLIVQIVYCLPVGNSMEVYILIFEYTYSLKLIRQRCHFSLMHTQVFPISEIFAMLL